MHEHTPPTYRLEFHLENMQRVTFHQDANLAEVINRAQASASMFTKLIKYCQQHPEETADLLYPDAPRFLVCNKKTKKWKKREKGGSLGKLYFASPSQGERYYLRMLLYTVRSPKSFADLRTHQGTVYETFKEACEARGSLENDREWDLCLTEAAAFQVGQQFRELLVAIIILHPTANARQLYARHLDSLFDDCRNNLFRTHRIASPTAQQIANLCLIDLERAIKQIDSSKSLAHFGLPQPSEDHGLQGEREMDLVAEELAWDAERLERDLSE